MRLFLFFSILVFFTGNVLSQSCNKFFTHVYGGDGNDEPLDVIQTLSGDYFIAGRTTSANANGYDGLLVKTDKSGKLSWSKKFGTSGFDEINQISEVKGQGLVGCGLSTGLGNDRGQPFFFKADSAGRIIWMRHFFKAEVSRSRLTAFIPLKSGGYGLVFTIRDSTSTSDGAIARMDEEGNLLWARKFDNGGADGFLTIAEKGDTLLVGGYSAMGAKAQQHGVVLKMNPANGQVYHTLALYQPLLFQASSHYNHKVVMLHDLGNSLDMVVSTEIFPRVNNTSTGLTFGLVKFNHAGRVQRERIIHAGAANGYTLETIKCFPSADGGVYFLTVDTTVWGGATIMKAGPSGLPEFGRMLFRNWEYGRTTAICEVAENVLVSAGYFESVFPATVRNMRMARIDPLATTGTCDFPQRLTFSDSIKHTFFDAQWSNVSALQNWMDIPVIPVPTDALVGVMDTCSKEICRTAPVFNSGCNAAFSVVIEGEGTMQVNDACQLSDGGYMAAGKVWYEYHTEEAILKLKPNGEREWVRVYTESIHTGEITRLIPVSENRILAVVSSHVTINHGGSDKTALMMLDNNGNVIWTKSFRHFDLDLYDIVPTANNEFIAVFNGSVGSGRVYGYMGRFDAQGNLKWFNSLQSDLNQTIYGALKIEGNELYVASNTYQPVNVLTIQKFNATTGQSQWNKKFMLDPKDGVRAQAILVKQDSIYFAYNVVREIDWNTIEYHTMVVKGTRAGSGFGAYQVDGVNYNVQSIVQGGMEHFPRFVTATSNGDFVTAQMAKDGDEKYFAITRFLPEGKPVWVKKFKTFGDYIAFSVKENVSNILISGRIDRGFGAIDHRTPASFIMSVSSDGELDAGTTGNCKSAPGKWSMSPLPEFRELISDYDKAEADTTVVLVNRQVNYRNFTLWTKLICNTPAVCNEIKLQGPQTICDSGTAIRYTIKRNSGCKADYKINADTAFFTIGMKEADYFDLVPKKAGSTRVEVALQTGCINLGDYADVTIQLPSAIDLGNDTTICIGDSIVLNPGGRQLNYVWNTGSKDTILIVKSTGLYAVIATDSCGRVYQDSIQVQVRAVVPMQVGENTGVCRGDTIVLQFPAGFGNLSVMPHATGHISNSKIRLFPYETTTYFFAGTDQSGCSGYDTLDVVVHIPIPFSLGNDTSFCKGNAVEIHAPAGLLAYQWSNGANTSSITVNAPDLYAVKTKDQHGCTFSDSMRVVSVFDNPKVQLPLYPVLCENGSVSLSAGFGFSRYVWNIGLTDAAIRVALPGTYWVEVADANGCLGSDTVVIAAFTPNPANFLNVTDSMCSYDKKVITTNGNFSEYRWSNGTVGNQITIEQPGVYAVVVTDNNGCVGTDTITVVQKECIVGMYMPNAFTPNGDGINDLIRPLIFGNILKYEFFVFDRYGNVIFSSKIPADGWNGMVKGQPFAAGSFVWKCLFQLEGQDVKLERGTFMLIR